MGSVKTTILTINLINLKKSRIINRVFEKLEIKHITGITR